MTTAPPEIADSTLTADRLDGAIDRAVGSLAAKQNRAGYWVGELEGDSILQSEYILVQWILGRESDPDLIKIAVRLRRQQNPDGGWGMYPGAPADVSATVKGYFALKLAGDDPDAPHMARARNLIRSRGGAELSNTFSRFFYACLGQVSFDACPSIPPEVVFLPRWFYFNLYNVSAWTRTMILPLGIVTTLRPVRKLPDRLGIAELFLDRAAADTLGTPRNGVPRTWRDFFLRFDRVLKGYERSPLHTLRQRALHKAERWLLDRMDDSEGLGAIFPPMVYMLVVLKSLGYPDDHPVVVKAHKDLKDFFIEEADAIRVQPCLSPVWDTGIALHALADTGIGPDDRNIKSATRWLLSKEVRYASDWAKKVGPIEPSGWYFEFQNPHYPDVDDTAMAVMSLKRVGGPAAEAAIRRGIAWLLAFQNSDGGWAAFDKTEPRPILEAIPFADHNAMQDPSCPDIAGRVLESLGCNGFRTGQLAIDRAVEFIHAQQDPCGAWWGRWGVNFIYGTWQVLVGLNGVGFDMGVEWVQKAASWLVSVQKPDGSFGETCASYDDPNLKGTGESTASQTAWGVMGMLAVVGPNHPAVKRGITWLVDHQAGHGGWDEAPFTGTGFPKVFYLKYHLYRHYFPLMALGRYRRLSLNTV